MAVDSQGTPRPLEGVKVIELGTLIAGPYAASVLAQFGAEVIKVESPGDGDPLRKWRKLHDGTSLWWYSQSRNKKSITLNLEGRSARSEIVRELVADADIVIENFRPGALEEWGLGWDDLSRVNPSLVMVRISGYGQTGPYKDRPGFAAIAEVDGRPALRHGLSGPSARARGRQHRRHARGAVRRDRRADRDAPRKVNGGKGQFIDVALYEAVFGVMESLMPEFSAFGHVRERTGASLPGIVPSNTYPCRDGKYVIIAGNSDGIFKRLMHAIGRADLADDPRARAQRRARAAERMLDEAIDAWTSQRDLEDVLATLVQADVPSGPIYTAADIHEDPHYRARDMIERHPLPDGTPIDFPGVVPKLCETPGGTRWLGPRLGEHTAEILASVGIGEEELAELREQGVI